MRTVQKTSSIEVVVDADRQAVWDVVSDVSRIGEWSHECRGARWLGADDHARPGARFRGRNRAGWLRWSRTSEIIVADTPRELVWRTVPTVFIPDSTEWRIELEEADGGTVIRQSFNVLRAPWVLDRLYAKLVPTHQDRDAKLRRDVLRLGAVARKGAAPRLGG